MSLTLIAFTAAVWLFAKHWSLPSDAPCLRDSDATAALGTAVDEHLNPTVTDVYQGVDEVIARTPENAFLVLRSTVYPSVIKLVYEGLASVCRRGSLARLLDAIAGCLAPRLWTASFTGDRGTRALVRETTESMHSPSRKKNAS